MANYRLSLGIALAFGGVILMSGNIAITGYQNLVVLIGVLIFIVGLALTIGEIIE